MSICSVKKHVLSEKFPVIIAKAIDDLNRRHYSPEHDVDPESIKQLISCLSKLRYEVMTNKPLSKLKLVSDWPCFDQFDTYLDELASKSSNLLCFFDCPTFFVEGYIYKRIHAHLLECSLSELPLFSIVRREHFEGCRALHAELLANCEKNQDLTKMLQLCTWSALCELDLFLDPLREQKKAPSMEKLLDCDESFASNLIKWDYLDFLSILQATKSQSRGLVLFPNSSGTELLCDMILADHLLQEQLVSRISFVLQRFPRLIDGVTRENIQTIIEAAKACAPDFASRWSARLDGCEAFQMIVDDFMESPFFLSEAETRAKEFHDKVFLNHDIVLLKGDRHFRSFVEGRNVASQNLAKPAVFSSRLILSDCLFGVDQSLTAHIKDNQWFLSGEYAIFQKL